MLKRDNYIIITWWMIDELKLKGNDLLVYALIYRYSQDGLHVFHWSLSYIAEWTNSTKQGVLLNLKNLLEKWLIEKKEQFKEWVKFCEYKITDLKKVLNYPIETIEKEEQKKEIKLKQDPEEYKFVDDFFNKDSLIIANLINNEDWKKKQYKAIDLLNRDWFSNEIIQVALQYIKQDDFRSKNILTITKLREKNKDWVPYIVYILDRIKNRKPKVIDLDK